MKVKPLIVACLFGSLIAGAFEPCAVDDTGLEKDIYVEILRGAYFRQTSDGLEPLVFVGLGPGAPASIEMYEIGLSGFEELQVSPYGKVSLQWGDVSIERPARNWSEAVLGFVFESDLAAATPAGPLTFQFQDGQGSFTALLDAPRWSLPTPRLINYQEATAIDPAQPFTFRWTNLTQNVATDYILLRIIRSDMDGLTEIFLASPCEPPYQGDSDAVINPSATSFTLPANILKRGTARYYLELVIGKFNDFVQGSGSPSWMVIAVDEKSTIIRLGLRDEIHPPLKPIITSQPSSQEVSEGLPVTFWVGTEFTDGLKYQWVKDGYRIPNAEASSYTIPAVKLGDGGEYRVSVYNDSGFTESEPAVLHVRSTVSTQPVGASLHLVHQATGGLILTATPESSGVLMIESSQDLVGWVPWKTNQVTSGTPVSISMPIGAGEHQGFFRPATPQSGSAVPNSPAIQSSFPVTKQRQVINSSTFRRHGSFTSISHRIK